MKVKELKNILSKYDDDFEVEVNLFTNVSPEELHKRTYKYPVDIDKCAFEFQDVSYSEKTLAFSVTRKEANE